MLQLESKCLLKTPTAPSLQAKPTLKTPEALRTYPAIVFHVEIRPCASKSRRRRIAATPENWRRSFHSAPTACGSGRTTNGFVPPPSGARADLCGKPALPTKRGEKCGWGLVQFRSGRVGRKIIADAGVLVNAVNLTRRVSRGDVRLGALRVWATLGVRSHQNSCEAFQVHCSALLPSPRISRKCCVNHRRNPSR